MLTLVSVDRINWTAKRLEVAGYMKVIIVVASENSVWEKLYIETRGQNQGTF